MSCPSAQEATYVDVEASLIDGDVWSYTMTHELKEVSDWSFLNLLIKEEEI